jgi:2-polyprenyl-6-methoxyphenol hydroxylase-like FAD-dependent oxidoreductase
MPAESSVDIVIVGGGPVGLSLALKLAQRGVRSTVIEKKREPDPHSRAVLLFPRTMEILRSIGVLDAFRRQGEINYHVRLRRADDRRTLLDFDFNRLDDVTECNFAIAIPQDRTDRILLEAALATDLITLRFGCEFVRFEETGTEDTPVAAYYRDADGREGKVRSHYLVGADGAHSSVRQQLGWELDGKTYPTRAFLADVEISEEADSADGLLMAAKAKSFVVSVRYAPGIWRIIEQDIPATVGPEQESAHARHLAGQLFGPEAWQRTIWTSAYKKHERCASSFRQGRILLVGDAAHLNSPAGGQGLNTGMRDAHNLAWKLDAILAGYGDPETLLSSYDIEQRSAFAKDVAPLTDKVERMQAAPAWMRKVAFSNLWIGRALGQDTALARRLSMLFTDYDASPILTGKAELVGRRMIDMSMPGGRLFERIGRWGLLLIRDDGNAPETIRQATSAAKSLGVPIARLPRALDERGFKNVGVVYVRPDQVIGHVVRTGSRVSVDDLRAAMGWRAGVTITAKMIK